MNTSISTAIKSVVITSALALSTFNANGSDYRAPNQLADGHFAGKYEEQRIGTGIGMFVGAVLGGPIGMVVAGVAGNQIGESEGKDVEVADLKERMNGSEQELVQLKQAHQEQMLLAQERMVAMQQQFVESQLHYEKQLSAMERINTMNKSLAVSLQFRTGSADIEPVYQQQLVEMAKVMNDMRQYSLDLSGYADRQGEESFNYKLSAERAAAVKAFLVSQGVDANRIQTKAYGETQPLQAKQTLQSDFFDRRVLMQLKPAAQAVAQN